MIRRNLFWVFAYNTVGVIVAALGWLNPAVAALLMVASSAIVIGNSLRLRQPFEMQLESSTAAAPHQGPRLSVPLALGMTPR